MNHQEKKNTRLISRVTPSRMPPATSRLPSPPPGASSPLSRPAAADDDLARTANYAEVADTVVRLVTGEPVDLIETLADRIARAVLAEQPVVAAVEVTVHKPQAPIPHDFADAAVTVHRTREDLA